MIKSALRNIGVFQGVKVSQIKAGYRKFRVISRELWTRTKKLLEDDNEGEGKNQICLLFSQRDFLFVDRRKNYFSGSTRHHRAKNQMLVK